MEVAFIADPAGGGYWVIQDSNQNVVFASDDWFAVTDKFDEIVSDTV